MSDLVVAILLIIGVPTALLLVKLLWYWIPKRVHLYAKDVPFGVSDANKKDKSEPYKVKDADNTSEPHPTPNSTNETDEDCIRELTKKEETIRRQEYEKAQIVKEYERRLEKVNKELMEIRLEYGRRMEDLEELSRKRDMLQDQENYIIRELEFKKTEKRDLNEQLKKQTEELKINQERIARINSQCQHDLKTILDENCRYAAPIVGRPSIDEDVVCCSVFAPSYVQERKRLLVQVYLHSTELEATVDKLAHEADSKTERRKYKSLSEKIKRGAKLEVGLVIENEDVVYKDTQHVEWQPPFVECTFKYKVPTDLPEDELSCDVYVGVDGIIIGTLTFLTTIADASIQRNAEVLAIPTKCVFISYAHKDVEQVQFLAEGYHALGNLEYFFDRHNLQPGDEFESKIFDYIDKSDLFILCWSKNAAESEWVTKERLYAFQKYIEGKGIASKRIRIYPLSMKPTADLPTDMGNVLNFGTLI